VTGHTRVLLWHWYWHWHEACVICLFCRCVCMSPSWPTARHYRSLLEMPITEFLNGRESSKAFQVTPNLNHSIICVFHSFNRLTNRDGGSYLDQIGTFDVFLSPAFISHQWDIRLRFTDYIHFYFVFCEG
jgi:hypothetical protein